MPTITEIVRSLESEISANDELIEARRAEIERMVSVASAENRKNFSSDEDSRAEGLFAEAQRVKAANNRKKDALSRARALQADEREQESRLDTVMHTSAHSASGARPDHRTASFSVTRNERTYRPDTDPNGRGFLMDVARSTVFDDRRASARLDRHMDEMRVDYAPYLERAVGDATTASYGVGLVVPTYLTDLYAPATAAMRPFANVMNRHNLPASGMTLNLSRITTSTSAALQASQLSAVSATSIGETDLAINVLTAAGSQNVSRQAIERGTGIEDVTMQDLFKRVATVVDSTVLTQASTGLTNTAQVTTYTSASPTATEFYPFVFQAESKLEQTLLGQARVSHVVMAIRRWNWLTSAVGTSFPFLQNTNFPGGSQTTAVQLTNEYGPSVRGVLSNGLKVVVDANVPTNLGVGTNQDEVYVVAADECHLWEDPNAPTMIRAEQANAASLGVLLVAYSYFGYTFGRYANNPAKISGTGLVAPAGF